MMKRWAWITALTLTIAMLLAACGGAKDAAGVVTDLEKLTGKLDSYHAVGTLKVNTGQQPQEYGAEVCYQNPSYYRIALTNKEKDITQIVLRNDDGVFVLTPHLNKSFRFQSDWPKNQGQAYLFETLVQSIVNDEERQFTTENDSYVFDVMANYQNASLVRQKIWLSKKDLSPQRVVVTDADANDMVTVEFSEFKFGHQFDKDYFDMQRNMTSLSISSVPVAADEGEGKETAKGKDEAAKQFGIIYPSYLPEGVSEKSVTEQKNGDNNAIVLRFTGDYNFTIIESPEKIAQTVSSMTGTIVDVEIGSTIGVMLGGEMKTLMWTADGVDFRLMSGDMTSEEMVKVAQSMIGQTGK
jgi:outer membrane lipoprotein-sorting protein